MQGVDANTLISEVMDVVVKKSFSNNFGGIQVSTVSDNKSMM